MEFFKEKVVCPRCSGNGLIYEARIVDLNRNVLVCDECEACWMDSTEIDVGKFEDFSTFLEKNGCSYTGSKIIEMGYDWYKK